MSDDALFDLSEFYGDPCQPDLEDATPVELVAQLTRPEREHRVRALIAQAYAIVDAAVSEHQDGHELVAQCLLWSGGNDSNVLAHLMRSRVTHAVHANTLIGIERTRQFVRDQCAQWGLPLLERTPPPGDRFNEWTATDGFPGPGHHFKAYDRLKGRALEQVRREFVRNGRRQRIVFIAGRRRSESRRRATVPAHERRDSVIWVSPLVMWTKLDLNTYRLMYADVPVNEVSDILHMSGECLCGSNAKPGERAMLRDWFPDVDRELSELERHARAGGVRHPLNVWGWGADPELRKLEVAGRPADNDSPLCAACDNWLWDSTGEAA